jgi:DNA-binding PadR family transcriptional regulator
MFFGKKSRQCALDILADVNPRWLLGREIIERSNGCLKSGTVYVWLDQLEDQNLIESEEIIQTIHYRGENIELPQQRYRITQAGLRSPKPFTLTQRLKALLSPETPNLAFR